MSDIKDYKKFICPLCKYRLYYRKSVSGFVCKNWHCKNYWKGNGPVLITVEEENTEQLGGC